MNIFKKNSSNSIIQDDIISLALSAEYEDRILTQEWENRQTLRAIAHFLGNRARKLAVILEDGVYVGPYKFRGRYLSENSQLELIDGDKKTSIKSLSSLGRYIRSKHEESVAPFTRITIDV